MSKLDNEEYLLWFTETFPYPGTLEGVRLYLKDELEKGMEMQKIAANLLVSTKTVREWRTTWNLKEKKKGQLPEGFWQCRDCGKILPDSKRVILKKGKSHFCERCAEISKAGAAFNCWERKNERK